MGYPYGDTYLEQIQKNPSECKEIEMAYRVLVEKYLKEHNKSDDIDLSLQETFSILGEAFELCSWTVRDISDQYHFMYDVLEILLTPKEEKNGKD